MYYVHVVCSTKFESVHEHLKGSRLENKIVKISKNGKYGLNIHTLSVLINRAKYNNI